MVVGAGAVGALTGFRLASASGPFRELAREIHGTVVLPSSGSYAQDKLSYNTRFDGVRPQAVVYCASAEDVQKTVRWARMHGIRLVARSGGHSYAGYSTTGSGVVVDVSRLKSVHASGGAATVGAGAHLIDVYAGLNAHGVTVPAGSCPTVGIAGLALGGGVGFAGRKLGLTSDNLLGVTLVTADGKLLECNAHEHPDLFWACRGGGGGNFGIATSFRFATHPVTDVSYYQVVWPWSDAAAALRAWQGFAPHAPDELFSTFFMGTTSPKGQGTLPAVSSGGQFFGSQADLQNLIAPLTSAGSPAHVSFGTLSYMDAMFRWAGCSSVPACDARGRLTFKGKSDYVNAPLSDAGIATLQSALEASQASASLGRAELIFDAYGGAINRVHPAETAFVHRNALFSIQYVSSWTAGGGADLQWLSNLYSAMRPYVSGFAYQNYIDPDLHSWQHAYYGSNLKRLVAVKKTYDPHNAFHFRQSIPTRV
ncbi:MAG TPA: FAD-binding oxidoreductase [Gaiellaceae bacterium]|nr:FAD-binding oxidoreductase [Gaiellaceae bacterium]